MIDGAQKTYPPITTAVIPHRPNITVRPIQIKYSVGKIQCTDIALQPLARVFIHLFNNKDNYS